MRILIISFSYIQRDPRVLRQINFVNSFPSAKVFLSGLSYEGDEDFIPLMQRGRSVFEKIKLVLFNLFNFNKVKEEHFLKLTNVNELEKLIVKNGIETIIANDLETWPVAFALKSHRQNLKIILDAHEYYPRHFEDKLLWKLMHRSYYNYVCKKYIVLADTLITVAELIGKEYEKEFGVKARIILNSPDYDMGLIPMPVDKDNIKLVHHGSAIPSRKIEKMINMMNYLDSRFHLYLILVTSDIKYYQHLQQISKGKQIKFLDPVPTSKISSYINQFDMGVFLLEPVNFNYEHALPNKFFEFVQARLGIAIGPSKEMQYYVEKYELGIVSDDFEEENIAKKINALSDYDISMMKKKADASADRLSNIHNIKIYQEIFEELNISPIN